MQFETNTIEQFKEWYRAASKLPVVVRLYVKGGVWLEQKTGELIFADSLLPVTAIHKNVVNIRVDEGNTWATPTDKECRFVVTID